VRLVHAPGVTPLEASFLNDRTDGFTTCGVLPLGQNPLKVNHPPRGPINQVFAILAFCEHTRNTLFPPDFLSGPLRVFGEMFVHFAKYRSIASFARSHRPCSGRRISGTEGRSRSVPSTSPALNSVQHLQTEAPEPASPVQSTAARHAHSRHPSVKTSHLGPPSGESHTKCHPWDPLLPTDVTEYP
jgi:hypothetical protein